MSERISPTTDELLAHSGWVRALARRLVRDPDAAEDVVQETWLAALTNPPRDARSVKPWLRRVVLTTTLFRSRGEGARTAREERAAKRDRLPSASELVERIEAQRVLVDEVLALDEPYRTAVALCYLEDLSAAEVARREGVPAATVRSRVSRGLALLRERLDRRFGERSTWVVAFLPLAGGGLLASALEGARRLLPGNEGAATAAGEIATGALTMGTIAKLAATAVGVAAVAFGVWKLAGHEPAAGTTRAAVTAPSPVELDAPAVPEPDAPVELAAPGASERVAALAGPELDAPPAGPKLSLPVFGEKHEPAVVSARFVDAGGNAVSGAVLRLVSGDEPPPVSGAMEELRGGAGDPGGVRSGLDGRVEMTVPMREEQSYQRFTYAAPGFALGSVEAKALAGETTPLGDLVLVPGASVAGFVVDPYKRRIADVEVWCSSDPVDDEELSTVLFRQGPLWKKALTPGNRRLSTRSGPDGSFFLAGAPAGTQRIWAHAEGRRYGWTPEIELVAGVAVSGIEVTSAELRTEDTISGVVLDPDGDPVANGEIRYGFEMPNFGLSSGLFTDSNGRFELVAWGDVPYRLTARAPRSQWADVAHPEVYPGTNDLVFQFREAEWIELVVRGEEGEAIAEPRVSLSFDEGSGKTQHTETQAGHTERRGEGKDERLFVRAHSSEFSIEVGAVGYARQSYGPFDPDSPPAKLTCELRRAAAIRGFVTADGAPVAGARVELYEPAPSHYTMDCDGFPTRLSCSPKESATSAEDGSFSMNFTADGRYVLRAEKDGFAATETDELELYARVGMSDIELPLTQGGRLVVTVRKADGSDPTGTVVGVSHGDGKAQTRRVGADGRVAFDKVTPGRWDVTEREVELDPSSRTATSSGLPDGVEAPEVPWVCEVHEGGTTRYELVIGE